MHHLDDLQLPSMPPLPASGCHDEAAMLRYGRECAAVGVFNERAAVLNELDLLAREFVAAGKPNIASRVRGTAEKIDKRLRQSERPPR